MLGAEKNMLWGNGHASQAWSLPLQLLGSFLRTPTTWLPLSHYTFVNTPSNPNRILLFIRLVALPSQASFCLHNYTGASNLSNLSFKVLQSSLAICVPWWPLLSQPNSALSIVTWHNYSVWLPASHKKKIYRSTKLLILVCSNSIRYIWEKRLFFCSSTESEAGEDRMTGNMKLQKQKKILQFQLFPKVYHWSQLQKYFFPYAIVHLTHLGEILPAKLLYFFLLPVFTVCFWH